MLYGCLDAAINGDFSLFVLKNNCSINKSLFEGTDDENIWDIGPWLFELKGCLLSEIEKQHAINLQFLTLFESNEDIDTLKDHLQSFIYYIPSPNNKYYFRIWDSRVMEKYLLSCNKKQLSIFFGGVIDKIICINGLNDNFMKKYHLNAIEALQIETITTAYWENSFLKRELNKNTGLREEEGYIKVEKETKKTRRFLAD